MHDAGADLLEHYAALSLTGDVGANYGACEAIVFDGVDGRLFRLGECGGEGVSQSFTPSIAVSNVSVVVEVAWRYLLYQRSNLVSDLHFRTP